MDNKERAKEIINAFAYNWESKRCTLTSISTALGSMEYHLEKDLDILMMKLLTTVPNKIKYIYFFPTGNNVYATLNNGDIVTLNAIVNDNHKIFLYKARTPYNGVTNEEKYSWDDLNTFSKIQVYTTFLTCMKEQYK